MKPALLLLHGALGSSRHFDPIVPVLQEQYTVHRFDFHGHGNTALPSSLSIEIFTTQLLDYIRDHQLSPVAIFGYSMGGYVALNAALQAPEAVLRVQTLATKFNWTPETAAKESRQLDATFLREKAPSFVAQLAELHGDDNWANLLPATAGLMTTLGNNPLLTKENLPQINIPVRLMVGDRDTMVGIEETLAVFRSLPQASMAVLPDTKHPLDKVNNAVLIWEIRSFMML
ncbi:alpha/beta fold hydrolase [Chitinophaga barathri]|uniref:Alpha/beta fold hydrolase n=1 Tax=Chitinophaga barathri TaxID=1647451 RepID=A0A3N4MEB5_9BACT|nr:alpha/beta fold hydrolase [Chitinophaga barathri]RPD42254.1 alpha/beta fold hydrolase [Chitinophaga barathri]